MRTAKWDAKQAKTNLFAQELKDAAGVLEQLEAELQAQIAELLGTLRGEIAKIPRPDFLPPQPELLPTTEPFEARELRRIERRDWKRVDKINSKQWGAYWTKDRFVRANHFQITILASQYLWVKDVRTKPLHRICDTAFYGIVGYWLRERERVMQGMDAEQCCMFFNVVVAA